MRKVLAGAAVLAFFATSALACPMAGGQSVSVDRELVVASISTGDLPQIEEINETDE